MFANKLSYLIVCSIDFVVYLHSSPICSSAARVLSGYGPVAFHSCVVGVGPRVAVYLKGPLA